eukprot:8291223-Pyramimonas_sp.AAC.1
MMCLSARTAPCGLSNYVVQYAWCKLRGAIHVARCMSCKLRGASYAAQPMWFMQSMVRNTCAYIHMSAGPLAGPPGCE